MQEWQEGGLSRHWRGDIGSCTFRCGLYLEYCGGSKVLEVFMGVYGGLFEFFYYKLRCLIFHEFLGIEERTETIVWSNSFKQDSMIKKTRPKLFYQNGCCSFLCINYLEVYSSSVVTSDGDNAFWDNCKGIIFKREHQNFILERTSRQINMR